jgi:hypothetical protein
VATENDTRPQAVSFGEPFAQTDFQNPSALKRRRSALRKSLSAVNTVIETDEVEALPVPSADDQATAEVSCATTWTID